MNQNVMYHINNIKNTAPHTLSKRFLAYVIDGAIAFGLSLVVSVVFLVSGLSDSIGVFYTSVMLLIILKDVFSIGKRTVKLQIVEATTEKKANLLARIIRNTTLFLMPVEVILLLLEKPRLGERLTHTKVIDYLLIPTKKRNRKQKNNVTVKQTTMFAYNNYKTNVSMDEALDTLTDLGYYVTIPPLSETPDSNVRKTISVSCAAPDALFKNFDNAWIEVYQDSDTAIKQKEMHFVEGGYICGWESLFCINHMLIQAKGRITNDILKAFGLSCKAKVSCPEGITLMPYTIEMGKDYEEILTKNGFSLYQSNIESPNKKINTLQKSYLAIHNEKGYGFHLFFYPENATVSKQTLGQLANSLTAPNYVYIECRLDEKLCLLYLPLDLVDQVKLLLSQTSESL